MAHFIQAILTFPAVLYTVLLGVVSLYWVSMLLGAVDLDLLGGADHGGADGAAHDVGHVADSPGHHDAGDIGDGGDGDHDGGAMTTMGAWSLRRVPVTVTISLLVIYGWLTSILGIVLLERAALAVMSSTVFHALVLAAALTVSLVLASVSARPLAPVFATRPAVTREGLVGKLAEVSTGRLDPSFGQVLVHDGGAGLILEARYDGSRTLKRGERVVVTSWDAQRNAAQVEPVDEFTALRVDAASESDGDESPRAAARNPTSGVRSQ